MTSPSADTLRSRYVEQAASDLEDNRRRQQELTEKIKMLEQEEALLVDIMHLAERHEGARPAAPRPERKKPSPTREKAAQPLLGDLLVELLAQYEEPRLARELRDELMQKHPDRSPTPQVVRNTLESLVAKGRIQRHKQQRSVMYTSTESGPAGTDG
ncbi:hypothetical protein ABII15_01260 [Streptomyces sp. HUAS MG91]|uniref:BlaI/MecI/CopY family transcriptional regulator n=1 Tax=Streptomyces tabacisoli TaxID=3156398 RepID=A0AAU8IJK6_9ACTN